MRSFIIKHLKKESNCDEHKFINFFMYAKIQGRICHLNWFEGVIINTTFFLYIKKSFHWKSYLKKLMTFYKVHINYKRNYKLQQLDFFSISFSIKFRLDNFLFFFFEASENSLKSSTSSKSFSLFTSIFPASLTSISYEHITCFILRPIWTSLEEPSYMTP